MYKNNHRLLLAVLLAACCMGAVAQNHSELPPVLKDMPQSGSMCRNERLPGAAMFGHARQGSVEASCALPVSGIGSLLQKGGAAVIDTRQEVDFAQFHMPNAMRMEAATIWSKEYLRDKPLLLVGDGKSDRDLYAHCGQLRSQGFRSVHVLTGGMAGYLAAGSAVSGRTTPTAFEAAQLDPAQLWAQSQFAESLVVVVNSPATAELLPLASRVADAGAQAIGSAVERRRKERKGLLANVTVAIEGPMTEESFRQYSQAVAPTPLLVYSGGSVALKTFLRSQEAAWAAMARGPKQPRCG